MKRPRLLQEGLGEEPHVVKKRRASGMKRSLAFEWLTHRADEITIGLGWSRFSFWMGAVFDLWDHSAGVGLSVGPMTKETLAADEYIFRRSAVVHVRFRPGDDKAFNAFANMGWRLGRWPSRRIALGLTQDSPKEKRWLVKAPYNPEASMLRQYLRALYRGDDDPFAWLPGTNEPTLFDDAS